MIGDEMIVQRVPNRGEVSALGLAVGLGIDEALLSGHVHEAFQFPDGLVGSLRTASGAREPGHNEHKGQK